MSGTATEIMLRVERVSIDFGAVQALHSLDLMIPPSGIFGLIGPNGSGKTTLFNAITGIQAVTAGRIYFNDREVTALPPYHVASLGIARTFQNLKIFKRLTVFENVLGAQTKLPEVRWWQCLRPGCDDERPRRERVEELLQLVGLAQHRNTLAQDLSLGEQRRLELARALAREPELLLLDEPAGGMTPWETDGMAELIDRISRAGSTVLLIEHKMGLIMRLCQHIAVLNFGCKIAEGPPGDIQSNPEVREAYLGREIADA